MVVWLVLLALAVALLYLNQIGLPGFLKRPLLDKLRAQGIELQFSRLRLRWYQGIVAENVRFGQAKQGPGPQLTLSQVEIELNSRALRRFQFQIDALRLREGRLVWPILETNRAPQQLAVENIQTELRFLPGDQWTLDRLTASFAGAEVKLSGTVSNASAIREWKVFRPADRPASPDHPAASAHASSSGLWQHHARQLADALDNIHFAAPPSIHLQISGDATDPRSFSARFSLGARGAATPQGTISSGRFTAQLSPVTTNGQLGADLALDAASASSRWASTTNLQIGIHLLYSEDQPDLLNGELSLRAGWVDSPWGRGTNGRLSVQWVHSLTNPVPLTGQAQLQCEDLRTPWGRAGTFLLAGNFSAPAATDALPRADSSWGGWAAIQPYLIDWQARLEDVQVRGILFQQVTGGGTWRAPDLVLTNLEARMEERSFSAGAALNVATRAATGHFGSSVDLRKFAPLLAGEAASWLEQASWEEPPQLRAEVGLTLPPWSGFPAAWSWEADIRSTLGAVGEVILPRGGSLRGFSLTGASSRFTLSNGVWHLPDLTLVRPEGRLEAALAFDDPARGFECSLHSTLDPLALRPLLGEKAQSGFGLISLTQPPEIQVEARGNLEDLARVTFRGRVAATNFAVRGEWASNVVADFHYTNHVLEVLQPKLEMGGRQMGAERMAIDLPDQWRERRRPRPAGAGHRPRDRAGGRALPLPQPAVGPGLGRDPAPGREQGGHAF